jgi:hypothetical protein
LRVKCRVHGIEALPLSFAPETQSCPQSTWNTASQRSSTFYYDCLWVVVVEMRFNVVWPI